MSMSETAKERPRRATKAPTRGPHVTSGTAEAAKTQPKQKGHDADLEYLLTNPKSKLTTLDISDIMNHGNFMKLSDESQELLCALLPPTAFNNHVPSLDSSHPAMAARRDPRIIIDQHFRIPANLDPTFFNNTFFLSGAKTFQDHLFSSWLTKTAKDSVLQYEQGVRDGGLHAEWKDEEWQRDHPVASSQLRLDVNDLAYLARHSLICQGDVIVYKRHFLTGTIVEKEVLVHSINPLSYAVDFLLAPGEISSLPKDLLIVEPSPPQPPILTMEGIMSSVELEEGVVDVDARVSRVDRLEGADIPRMNFWGDVRTNPLAVNAVRAAKALSVWRWTDEMKSDLEMQIALDKAGRGFLGTVYYLRRA